MEAIVRHLWVALVAVMIANALIFRVRSCRYIAENPSLESGYRRLIWGFLIWGNIPWVIIGLGCELGGVPSVLHFVRPRDGNPFVLAFFASVVLIWVLGSYWLFARGGAETMIRHPGLLNAKLQSPALVKIMWCVFLAGGILAAVAMFVTETPLPTMAP
jgi:hypothetical protein